MQQLPSRYALARQAVRTFPRTASTTRTAINGHRRKWIAAVMSLGQNWRGIAVRLPIVRQQEVQ